MKWSMFMKTPITFIIKTFCPSKFQVTFVGPEAPAALIQNVFTLCATNGDEKSTVTITWESVAPPVISIRAEFVLPFPRQFETAPTPASAPLYVRFDVGSSLSPGAHCFQLWKSFTSPNTFAAGASIAIDRSTFNRAGFAAATAKITPTTSTKIPKILSSTSPPLRKIFRGRGATSGVGSRLVEFQQDFEADHVGAKTYADLADAHREIFGRGYRAGVGVYGQPPGKIAVGAGGGNVAKIVGRNGEPRFGFVTFERNRANLFQPQRDFALESHVAGSVPPAGWLPSQLPGRRIAGRVDSILVVD